MMREIKFRAWAGAIMLDSGFSINPHGHIYNIRKEHSPNFKLMQYTGLKDKNGVEIYEGDIVECWSYGYNDGGMGDKKVLEVVKWNEAQACFDSCLDLKRGVEVVGNIHENPDLIK